MSKPARRGPGRPPQSSASDTRRRLISAARGVFSETGYSAATFQAIAMRADLTRPAVNHYFSNKRELYRQVVGDTLEDVLQRGMESARAEKGLTAKMAAFALVASASGPSVAAFLVTIQHEARNEELAEEARRYSDTVRNFVGWALDDAIELVEIEGDSPAEIHTLTEALLVMLTGFHFYIGYMGSGPMLGQIMRIATRD